MTFAILTFEDLAPMEGRAETEDDYIQFRTEARLSNQQLNELHRARIEISGQIETVLLESTDPCYATSDITDLHRPLRLTLRRHILPTS
ncbi:MAG: hypothetical protein FJX25_05275 [Alphaproteobacteria bacterium]|nr:hypothetical protein [Alphaproteobacteria bacterium]